MEPEATLELTLEQIEKVIQSVVSRVQHETAPETRQLIANLENKLSLHRDEEQEWIAAAIKTNVNGKIDKMREDLANHNEKHENDMRRLMPIIESYETAVRTTSDAKKVGTIAMWWAAFIIAMGSAFLTIKHLFT